MIDLFSSDESLEGILHVDPPEKPATVFYVVFSGIPDTEQNEELKSSPKTSLLILMTQLTLPNVIR